MTRSLLSCLLNEPGFVVVNGSVYLVDRFYLKDPGQQGMWKIFSFREDIQLARKNVNI